MKHKFNISLLDLLVAIATNKLLEVIILEKYDFIVVGAGPAGRIAAYYGAKLGLKTLLLDAKPREKIGHKTCGDAIGHHHFVHVGVPAPKEFPEVERFVKGIDVYSPDKETVFRVASPELHGYIIDRPSFAKRQLKIVEDAGAELLFNTKAIEPVIENNFVVGVKVKQNEKITEIHGKVVVDATGMMATLRKHIPDEWGIEKQVISEDVAIVYREIRDLKKRFGEPEYQQIYLSQEIAPGGYVWIFFKRDLEDGGVRVNTGLGVSMALKIDPKKQFYNKVLPWDIFKDSTLVHGAGAPVTVRRPLNTLTGNGFMVAGDAASAANPVHGGGIGSSMLSGKLAAETVADALESGDVSQKGLWRYNVRYNQEYGAKQAALDVFRIFLQGLKDDDLNYGMRAQLITEDDLLKANLGEDLKLNITEKAKRLLKGWRKLGLLNDLRYVADKMKEAKQLYLNYPESPENFNEWRKRSEAFFKEVRKRFWKQ